MALNLKELQVSKRNKQTRKNRGGFYVIRFEDRHKDRYVLTRKNVVKIVDLENASKFKSQEKAINTKKSLTEKKLLVGENFSVVFVGTPQENSI